MRFGLSAGVLMLGMLGLYALDRQFLFLAHPFWSPWVITGGLAVCVMLGLLLPHVTVWQGIAALIIGVIAAVLSWNGRADFAASYAEDALAGRFWYLGYHAAIWLLAFGFARLTGAWLK